MLSKALLIVSDKFRHFATHKDVITKTSLYNLLNSTNSIISDNTKIRLIPGQGFSQKTIDEVLILAKTSRNARNFDFSLWKKIPPRASKKLTHKHHDENILISEPKKISEQKFTMDILIDEECEMMKDHQTGLHVQGMLLLEASRQGYLSIFEKFFFQENNEKKYFIFNNLNVDYNRFAFPLPATLSVNIREIDVSNHKKQNAIMDMEIFQCDNISASFSLNMTMMADKRIAHMESKLANDSVNVHINHLLNHTESKELAHA